ncbi:recQ [Mytilus coruscus]|uniref:DNA 3'-5' helicase n=1 Tax=Mytilus coruscus TaxID=42192 RepID=A0A6J8CSD6_MYTCO|nr:recQ [Mytilus coruscus]
MDRYIDDVMKELGNLQLKEEQKTVIESILKKQDTLAVLPTGYGKSMCYIVPPLILNKEDFTKKHTSLVISPLKTLMKDQISSLREHNIPAYGLLEGAEKEDLAVTCIKDGLASILFASPEVILVKFWRDVITEVYKDRICVVAYDEAHCISEWGLDFRPEYGKVGLLQSIIEAPVLVLSATIRNDIRKDIDRALGLQQHSTKVVATLPDRSNIFLCTDKSSEQYEVELKWILEGVKQKKGKFAKTIIYVNSIALCETLYIWIHSELKSALYNGESIIQNRMVEMYHAHTDDESKQRIMDQFISIDSTIRVLVATVACGMGVNIPNIKLVVLWGLPSTLLLLWQETGRCVRDGSFGLMICYAFKRSVSKPCDICRSNRKFQCKCSSQEYLRSLVETEQCQRSYLLRHFLLDGMSRQLLPCNDFNCTENCHSCSCVKCKCCIVCRRKCECSKNMTKDEIIRTFLED